MIIAVKNAIYAIALLILKNPPCPFSGFTTLLHKLGEMHAASQLNSFREVATTSNLSSYKQGKKVRKEKTNQR